MNKIEHLGIAVKDLTAANKTYSILLNAEPYKEETVDSEGVVTSFFKVGDSKIELLQGITEDSAITKYIEKYGEGIHHIAFAVDDIVSEIQRLEKEGFRLIHQEPKKGADGKMIAFLHPKSSHGVLVELCMDAQ